MNNNSTPKDLQAKFDEINTKSLENSRRRYEEETQQNTKILDTHNRDAFDLRKDLLVLNGTIFGSSIALATGKVINNFFILGEFLLFLSIFSGLLILLSHLRWKEWDYSFSSKNSIESYLLLNRDKMDKFERENLEKLAKEYEHLLNSNKIGLSYKILKLIPLEKWQRFFNYTFILGVGFIFISILTPSQIWKPLYDLSDFVLKSIFK